MKRVGLILGLLLAVSLAWAGGDPWEKEYKSWSKDDVQKVLYDSPWAKRVTTKEAYATDSSENKSTGGKQTASALERGALQPVEFATVVWWTSKTPRRAYLRTAELNGQQVSADQYKQFAESPVDVPTVAVWESNAVMALAAKLDPEQLKKSAYLDSPRLKKKIAPVEVTVLKKEDGKPDRIVFTFPKDLDGQPLVTGEDKKLIFKWRLPREAKETVEKARQFDAQFQPAKMMALGQADL